MSRDALPDGKSSCDPWPTIEGLRDTGEEGTGASRDFSDACLRAPVKEGEARDSALSSDQDDGSQTPVLILFLNVFYKIGLMDN